MRNDFYRKLGREDGHAQVLADPGQPCAIGLDYPHCTGQEEILPKDAIDHGFSEGVGHRHDGLCQDAMGLHVVGLRGLFDPKRVYLTQ